MKEGIIDSFNDFFREFGQCKPLEWKRIRSSACVNKKTLEEEEGKSRFIVQDSNIANKEFGLSYAQEASYCFYSQVNLDLQDLIFFKKKAYRITHKKEIEAGLQEIYVYRGVRVLNEKY